MTDDITVHIAKAPSGMTVQQFMLQMQLDPYQTRVSQSPIVLTHPRTGKQKVFHEYVENFFDASRFAVQVDKYIVFISRLQNSQMGTIYKPMTMVPIEQMDTVFDKKKDTNLEEGESK